MKKFIKKVFNKFLSLNNLCSRWCVRLKRQYRIKKFNQQGRKIIEIGGGKFPMSTRNLNIDVLDYHTVDILENIIMISDV